MPLRSVGRGQYLLGSVVWIPESRREVARALRRANPDLLAVDLSREEVEGLVSIAGGARMDTSLSPWEEGLVRQLARLGPISVPASGYLALCERAVEADLPIFPLGLSHRAAELAWRGGRGLGMVWWELRRMRSLSRKPIGGDRPETVADGWHAACWSIAGYRAMEAASVARLGELVPLLEGRGRSLTLVARHRYKPLIDLLLGDGKGKAHGAHLGR